MPKAIFVSVTQTLKRAEKPDLNQDSDFLRHATCGWWRVNADRARGLEYVVGVWSPGEGAPAGQVVSVYRVAEREPTKWPRIPTRSIDASRRYIPVVPVSSSSWASATLLTGVAMDGPIRYGELHLGANGDVVGVAANADLSPEEAADADLQADEAIEYASEGG